MGLPCADINQEADLIVKVADAKNRLSELIARAEAGERIVISRGAEPAVELTPIRRLLSPVGILKALGFDVDSERLAEQIEAPYTEEELDEFEGDLDEELKQA